MSTRILSSFVVLMASMLLACAGESADAEKAPNFIVLIGDDMSVETVGCYGVGADPARTPQIDQICNSGMRFDNFWSQPVCSPTRATILTGQFGFRNGVGTPAAGPDMEFPVPDSPPTAPTEIGGGGDGGGANRELPVNPNAQREGYTEPPNERPSIKRAAYGLPAALAADESLGYQSAAVGKWHLANDENGALEHTSIVGFDHYAGSYNGGAVESFFAWSKVIDAQVTAGQTGYATTETVNDAIAWLADKDEDRPWLLWVAFNAPHSPYGAPPAELLSEATAAKLAQTDINDDGHAFYAAMIEAMDTEIGRLLAAVDAEELANTYVIFIGDNGTPGPMATSPFSRNRVKGTVYQGGVNVPFVVAGPGLDNGTVSLSLANSVDLFATILDLAGAGTDTKLSNVALDGVSLAPVFADHAARVRSFAYADVFGPQRNGIANERAIRDERFKLIIDLQNDSEEFYDLATDPYENNNLLEGELSADARAGYDGLVAQLEALLASR